MEKSAKIPNTVEVQIDTKDLNQYLVDLLMEMAEVYRTTLLKVIERGTKNGYGDALKPTGGALNLFAIIERKQDRLRAQVWDKALGNRGVLGPVGPEVLDTIEDEINYLMFLRILLGKTEK